MITLTSVKVLERDVSSSTGSGLVGIELSNVRQEPVRHHLRQ